MLPKAASITCVCVFCFVGKALDRCPGPCCMHTWQYLELFRTVVPGVSGGGVELAGLVLRNPLVKRK